MSLGDIYSQSVKGKAIGGLPTVGSAAPPIIERDPQVRKLEQDVFARMHEIVKPEPLDQGQATPDVEFVSLEQALKELQQMNNGN
jgi:primosomal protein N''